MPRLLNECHRWSHSGRNAIGFKVWSRDTGSSVLVVAQGSGSEQLRVRRVGADARQASLPGPGRSAPGSTSAQVQLSSSLETDFCTTSTGTTLWAYQHPRWSFLFRSWPCSFNLGQRRMQCGPAQRTRRRRSLPECTQGWSTENVIHSPLTSYHVITRTFGSPYTRKLSHLCHIL